MLPNKAAGQGQGGVVVEMLKSLDCLALDAIRVCFENRLNGVGVYWAGGPLEHHHGPLHS